MAPTRTIVQLAALQGGVVRRDQLIRAGFSASAVSRRLEAGELTEAARGVYRVFDPTDRVSRLHAAVAALPGSVVSHQSAAMLHQLSGFDRSICAVTVGISSTHRFGGAIVHRVRDLKPTHVTRIGRLPVTRIERTLFDLAPHVDSDKLSCLIDDLLVSKRIAIDGLDGLLAEIGGRGKPGTAVMRELLDERRFSVDPDSTPLERAGLKVLASADLEGLETQYSPPFAPGWRFDAAVPAAAVAIEWDSRRWHTRVEDFERDRRRDRIAAANGWVILRFTMADVADRPAAVVEDVVKTIGSRMLATGRR